MTDRQYHRALIHLAGKLARAACAKPYDPDAYNAVIDELNALSDVRLTARRRTPWFMFCILIIASLVLAYIIYDVLFYL